MHEPHQVAQKLMSTICFAGFFTKRFQVGGRRHFQLDWLFFDPSERFHAGRGLFLPLRRAAEDTGVFHTGTSRFASNASTALRASWVFTISLR
jgi:hypothetical protein